MKIGISIQVYGTKKTAIIFFTDKEYCHSVIVLPDRVGSWGHQPKLIKEWTSEPKLDVK